MILSRTYNTKELQLITGESKQRIQYWILNGIISPYTPSAGTGTSRYYSFENLLEVLIVQTLSRLRIDIKIIANIMREIKQEIPGFFKSTNYEHDEKAQLILISNIMPDGSTHSSVITLKGLQTNFLSDTWETRNIVITMNLDVTKNYLLERIDNSNSGQSDNLLKQQQESYMVI